MASKSPLHDLPEKTQTDLMILFFQTKEKVLEMAYGIEDEFSMTDDDLDRMIVGAISGSFWKGYSIGVADAMRVLDNAKPEEVIQQAEEHLSTLTTEMQVQSFMDEIEEFERNGGEDG